MRRRPRQARPATVALAVLACLLSGCRRHASTTVVSRSTARPALRGADRGLELWAWAVSDPRLQPPDDPQTQAPRLLVRDDKTDIESLLGPYLGRPVPMTDERREAWRTSGFRIVAVPARDLEKILNASRLVGTVQRQWLGESPRWADAVPGVRLTDPRAVTLADGSTELEPGRLRLLVRAWVVPVEQDQGVPRGGLHLELAPRLDPATPARERLIAAVSGGDQPPRAFPSLASSFTTASDDAILIIADAPSADWARPAAPAAEDEFGPHAQPLPTLGEVMLSIPATTRSVRTRSVIALVPHIPERFELLPP